MSIGSGIAAQAGGKAESVYGTPVTPDRFWEFNSESIATQVVKPRSMGLRNARFQRADREKTVVIGASGSIEMDVLNKNFGLLFEHALGQNTVSGVSANKTHTIIPDALAQQGKFMTFQIGRPDATGTIRAFTFEGGKINGFTLSCALDEVLKASFDFDFENVLTATALASASYVATQEPFVFSEGALTVGGSAITPVRNFTLQYQANLKTDRRGLGNVKKEPLANAHAVISGTIEAEFDDLTQYAAFIAGTQAQLVLTFTTATVIPTTAVAYSLVVTIPLIVYMSADNQVGGPDVVPETLAFEGLDNGSTFPIQIVITTSDTAS